MKTFVVIATYNERDNIEKLVPAIFRILPDTNLLIVDDNSPDGTSNLVTELKDRYPGLHLVTRSGKLGYGTAFIRGFEYALEHDTEIIVTMDADFSHDPEEIPRFIEKINGADVVVGSRYVNGIRILNWPLRRLLLSSFANMYVNLVLNMKIKDCTSGFRCYRAEVFNKIPFPECKSRGYAFLVEVLYRVKQAGFAIVEHPVVYTERREGQSKMSRSLIIESFFRPIFMRLERFRKPAAPKSS